MRQQTDRSHEGCSGSQSPGLTFSGPRLNGNAGCGFFPRHGPAERALAGRLNKEWPPVRLG